MALALVAKVFDTQANQQFDATFERFPVRIGRHQLNDLQIDRPYVSQFHAAIDLRETQIFIRDLGSTNGTAYQGRRLVRDGARRPRRRRRIRSLRHRRRPGAIRRAWRRIAPRDAGGGWHLGEQIGRALAVGLPFQGEVTDVAHAALPVGSTSNGGDRRCAAPGRRSGR